MEEIILGGFPFIGMQAIGLKYSNDISFDYYAASQHAAGHSKMKALGLFRLDMQTG